MIKDLDTLDLSSSLKLEQFSSVTVNTNSWVNDVLRMKQKYFFFSRLVNTGHNLVLRTLESSTLDTFIYRLDKYFAASPRLTSFALPYL